MMKQAHGSLRITTRGRGLLDITKDVESWVSQQGIGVGLLTVFIRHTSASLTIQENADPEVLHDLEGFFQRLVPDDTTLYRHTSEGTDDMPAHIRSTLTNVSLSIPIIAGRPGLGTWQGVYVFEHRNRAHTREMLLHLVGE